MQSARIQDLHLLPAAQQLLLSHNMLTAKDVLAYTLTDLMELLDIPYSSAQQLLLDVSAQVAPAYMTALQLYNNSAQQTQYVLSSLPSLDAALRRGMPPGGITEMVSTV